MCYVGYWCLLVVSNMLPVSLHRPFLIVPSVFSNVYFPVSLHRPFLIVPSVFSNVYFPVSLCCPFLIVPSVFSNVYFPVSLDCSFLIALSVYSNVYFPSKHRTLISTKVLININYMYHLFCILNFVP